MVYKACGFQGKKYCHDNGDNDDNDDDCFKSFQMTRTPDVPPG